MSKSGAIIDDSTDKKVVFCRFLLHFPEKNDTINKNMAAGEIDGPAARRQGRVNPWNPIRC